MDIKSIYQAKNASIEYQNKTSRYFDKKVKTKSFQVNDLVLREAVASQPTSVGKLTAPWEGPYEIRKVVSLGTYELEHLDGEPVKNAWNGVHLKKFYQ